MEGEKKDTGREKLNDSIKRNSSLFPKKGNVISREGEGGRGAKDGG